MPLPRGLLTPQCYKEKFLQNGFPTITSRISSLAWQTPPPSLGNTPRQGAALNCASPGLASASPAGVT